MKTIPVSQVRQNIYQLVDETIKSSEPVQITTKRGNAILISEADWEDIQETLYLLSIPGMRECVKEADDTPREKWLEDIGWDID